MPQGFAAACLLAVRTGCRVPIAGAQVTSDPSSAWGAGTPELVVCFDTLLLP